MNPNERRKEAVLLISFIHALESHSMEAARSLIYQSITCRLTFELELAWNSFNPFSYIKKKGFTDTLAGDCAHKHTK